MLSPAGERRGQEPSGRTPSQAGGGPPGTASFQPWGRRRVGPGKPVLPSGGRSLWGGRLGPGHGAWPQISRGCPCISLPSCSPELTRAPAASRWCLDALQGLPWPRSSGAPAPDSADGRWARAVPHSCGGALHCGVAPQQPLGCAVISSILQMRKLRSGELTVRDPPSPPLPRAQPGTCPCQQPPLVPDAPKLHGTRLLPTSSYRRRPPPCRTLPA